MNLTIKAQVDAYVQAMQSAHNKTRPFGEADEEE